jgi:CRP-like cAMP-binding protein
VAGSETADALRRVPILADLDEADLAELAERFQEHTFPAGTTITREGERGARVLAFFLIVGGTASVTRAGAPLATLGAGDHFGEIALFRDEPRMATVFADSERRCLALSSWEFRPFVESHPDVARRMLEAMALRLEEARRLD